MARQSAKQYEHLLSLLHDWNFCSRVGEVDALDSSSESESEEKLKHGNSSKSKDNKATATQDDIQPPGEPAPSGLLVIGADRGRSDAAGADVAESVARSQSDVHLVAVRTGA